MPTVVTTGLVIRRADYSDYDRMITVFSPELGRLDAIARGCRRPKSPLLNAAEPFTSGEFQFYVNRDRYALEQCTISESYYGLRSDYDRLRHGAYWLRLLDDAVLPDTPAPELFITTLKALAHLSYGEQPPELVTFAFEAHFMRLNGMSPRMDACVRCGRPIDGPCRFDADLGGAVCSHCLSDAPEITDGARRILMKLPRTRFERYELLADRPEWPEAARLMRGYVNERMHMGRFTPPLIDDPAEEVSPPSH